MKYVEKLGFEFDETKGCYVYGEEEVRLEIVFTKSYRGILRVEYFGCMEELYNYYTFDYMCDLEEILKSLEMFDL